MSRKQIHAAMRWTMAALYLTAGVLHLILPNSFVAITPDWVPHPRDVIMVTGICELLGAVGLLVPRLQGFAGGMLALYAFCVFPANIKHAFAHVPVAGMTLGWAYHAPRLAAQPLLIWWALFSTELIDWPWRRDGR